MSQFQLRVCADTLILSVEIEACFLTTKLGSSSAMQENVEWDREGAQQSQSSRLRRKCVKQQQKKHLNCFSTTHLRPNCTQGSALSGKQGYEDRGKTFETLRQRTTQLESSSETLPVVCNYGLSVQIPQKCMYLNNIYKSEGENIKDQVSIYSSIKSCKLQYLHPSIDQCTKNMNPPKFCLKWTNNIK